VVVVWWWWWKKNVKGKKRKSKGLRKEKEAVCVAGFA